MPTAAERPEAARPLDATLRQIEQEREEGLPLRKILQILSRRRWLILTTSTAILLGALLQTWTTTPLYRSLATLQIDPDAPKILPYEASADSSLSPKARQEYLETQARKLQTRALASRAIHRLKLDNQPEFTSRVQKGFFIDRLHGLAAGLRGLFGLRDRSVDERVYVNRFLENLGIQVLRNTRLVEVSFTSPDPELAAEVVNTLVEEFIEQNLESRYQATTHVTGFLSEQLTDLKATVEESEARLLDYARAKDIVNLNERETLNAGKLADLTDELTRVEAEMIEQRARHQALAGASPAEFPPMLQNPAIVRLEERLSEDRQRLAGLESRHGSQWPAVVELRQQIAELDQQLVGQKQAALDLARSTYGVAEERLRGLERAVAEQRGLVDRLNDNSIQYNILKREVDTNKELYEGLLQRLKEAGVAAGLGWTNIQLADQAVVPRRPSFPRRPLAVAVAVVLGLFLGVGAAFLAEALDDTFSTTEEVTEALRLPALGMIPLLDELGQTPSAKSPSAKSLVVRPRGSKEGSRSPIIAYQRSENLQAPEWEAYRSLRTSLLLSHSSKPPQSILVTSALPGEGKSTTVANTAIVLAQTGSRTLILDLDLRKPMMADLFGVSDQQGMSVFLSGNSDLSSLICESSFPNLYLLPAGPPAPNPAELLGSERLRSGIAWLQEYFDFIIIDSPPCLEITDSLVLSPQVDGLLLVVRAGKTPRELVRKASDRLLRVGGKILGVLINAGDVRRSDYGYYYGYYRSYYGRSPESRRRSA